MWPVPPHPAVLEVPENLEGRQLRAVRAAPAAHEALAHPEHPVNRPVRAGLKAPEVRVVLPAQADREVHRRRDPVVREVRGALGRDPP